ncbi:hypothetical protein CHCC20375_1549 [Bacillus licheniformis]|nr:hypothetical protein CHCC20375_1549 [Bacillus licheniformis]
MLFDGMRLFCFPFSQKSRLIATGGFIHIIRKAQTSSTVQTFS